VIRHKAAVLAVLFCLALPFALAACGKKGDPLPDASLQSFSWRNVFATVTESGCVNVAGSASGAIRNVQTMRLELQPYDAACEGCPFVPWEVFSIRAVEAWETPGGDTFRFAYCPGNAGEAYRWRLAGHNSVPGYPVVLTPVRTARAE
jgi:hypothetical protein